MPNPPSQQENSNNSPFIVITGLVVAIGRIVLGNIELTNGTDEIVLIVMAIVNYVALGFVLLFLYNGFYDNYKNRLAQSGLQTNLKKRSIFISHIVSFIVLLFYFVVACFYITKWYNSNYNDAISIFALAISIATDGLIKKYSTVFYKLLNRIAKLTFRNTKKQEN